jgi:ATP-binding cassette subfamily B protein
MDAPVLVFDDSLSAVDTDTDLKIREALKDRIKGVTTLLITHRIATAQSADQIIVLDKGRIIQRGTHDELIQQEGLYRTIYDIQSRIN